MWTAALLEVIGREAPGFAVTADHLHPYLQSGFPWHMPDQPHLDIKSPEQWWNALDSVFERAFDAIGIDVSRARVMAKEVRHVYSYSGHWRLYNDTLPTLDQLSSQGWTHVVLSNHTPELREIIRYLGLESRLAAVFNSAEIGYEKPHPQAFRSVLGAFGNAAVEWLIGDNYGADVVGAESLGIPGILVRKTHKNAKRYCSDLSQVPAIISEKNERMSSGSDGV